MPTHFRRTTLTALAVVLATRPVASQGPSGTPSDQPAGTSQATALPFSFSGVMYVNYQYGGTKSARSENRFDLDRAYLNFRSAAGDRDSIRVTLDVYQQRDATKDQYYRGWTMRVKYGYLQHEVLRGSPSQVRAAVRLGLLHTAIIDKEEQFWNRGLSQVAAEQVGFFSSADAGVAAAITLPNRAGEVYATIVNGNGYGSRETDRFKDFQARVTLTPFANGSGALKGLQLSPWVSVGGRASDFATRRGTVQPVTEARERNRYGFLVNYRDARLTLGAHLARKVDVAESADTTRDVRPVTATITGNLTSAYVIARPAMFASNRTSSPWSLVARVDDFQPDDNSNGTQRRYIVGTGWDLSSRTSVTFDVQSTSPRDGLAGSPTRIFYLHLISSF